MGGTLNDDPSGLFPKPPTNPIATPGQATSQPAAPAAQAAAPQSAPLPPFATNTPGFNGSGATPAYGTQSPSMFGTGQYVAPLLPINDQAITGAPSQGASTNYGLNGVWSNLSNELAAAPTQGAGMVAPAQAQAAQFQAATGAAAQAGPAAISTAGDAAFQQQQQQLANTLQTQANGGGTSAADLQLAQGNTANIAAQLAVLGSQRGSTNAALAQRSAADQGMAQNAATNAQMGVQRAQETATAQQALGSVLGTARGQAQTYNANQAQIDQQTALANQSATNAMTSGNLSAVNAANLGNAQLSQQTSLANQGAANAGELANQNTQLANAQLYDQQFNAITGAQTGIANSDKAASLADQQLQLQQMIAANQTNEQGYAASAAANQNLTGAVIGGVTSLASAGINAATKAGAAANYDPTFSLPQSQTISLDPSNNPYLTISDENLKTGIEGGNPMLRSFLSSYRDSSQTQSKPIDVNEGSAFRGPTMAKGAASAGAGSGIGSGIGSILGGILGSVVAPGVGTALGAAAGGAVGGAVGGGIDPASGGGTYMASPGTGETVDESGWDQAPSAAPAGDGMALSDDREKSAVTSGNRGMQAFLQQANAQTNAQNGQGAQSNAFMQTGMAPSNQVDRQLPPNLGGYGAQQAVQPPFVQQGGAYGAADGGGITNYGGFAGGSSTSGALTAAPGQQFTAPALAPIASQQTTSPTGLYGALGAALSGANAAPRTTSAMAPAAQQSNQFPYLGALSDEREKVKTTDDARFGELGMLKRPDGDVSTEISITVTDPRINGGAPTNIPTLVKGQVAVNSLLSGKAPTHQQYDMAVKRAAERLKAGATLPSFGSIDEAVKAAEERSATKGQMIDSGEDVLGSKPVAAPMPLPPSWSGPLPLPSSTKAQTYGGQSPAVPWHVDVGQAQDVQPMPAAPGYQVSFGPAQIEPPFAQTPPSAAPPVLSDETQKTKSNDVQAMLDQLHAYQYRYKNPNAPGAAPGERLGVMAQDLQKSPLGAQFVKEQPDGTLAVDYGQMSGTQLAASAMLNERLDQHEKMLKHLMGGQ